MQNMQTLTPAVDKFILSNTQWLKSGPGYQGYVMSPGEELFIFFDCLFFKHHKSHLIVTILWHKSPNYVVDFIDK